MDYTKSLWAVRSFRKTEKSPDRNQKALLHVNDVTASYSKSIEMPPVLSEVNFEIYRGETVAVVGEIRQWQKYYGKGHHWFALTHGRQNYF